MGFFLFFERHFIQLHFASIYHDSNVVKSHIMSFIQKIPLMHDKLFKAAL